MEQNEKGVKHCQRGWRAKPDVTGVSGQRGPRGQEGLLAGAPRKGTSRRRGAGEGPGQGHRRGGGGKGTVVVSRRAEKQPEGEVVRSSVGVSGAGTGEVEMLVGVRTQTSSLGLRSTGQGS